MYSHNTVLAVLAILAATGRAQVVYTVTQYPSICSAIYTSGLQSVTIVQSTVTTTATPSPLSDAGANSGTPFLLELEQPTPYGSKRQASTRFWLKSDGNTTTDVTLAAQYVINAGQLGLQTGGFYSTSQGVSQQPFAAATTIGPLNTTFMIYAGALTWSNAAFTSGGYAQFYKTPAALVDNAQVIVTFNLQSQNIPASWAPLKLAARAVSAANPPSSSLAVTIVVTSIMGYSSMPVYTYAPTSAAAMATSSASNINSVSTATASTVPGYTFSTSSVLAMTLSTISAPGVPIGPNRPSGLSINATAPPGTDTVLPSTTSSLVATTVPDNGASTMSSSVVVPSTTTAAPSTSTITMISVSTSSTQLTSTTSPSLAVYASSSSLLSTALAPGSSTSQSTMTLTSTTTTLMSMTTSLVTTVTPLISMSSSATSPSTSSTSSTIAPIVTGSSAPAFYGISSSGISSSSSVPMVASSTIQSTSSSVSMSTAMAPTSTSTVAATTYSCPAANGATVTDSWGTSYVVGCGQDTTDGNYDSQAASTSWNDCFQKCHYSNTTQGVGKCTAFTYLGGTNGVGSGTCFLKDQAGISFTGSGSGLVAAIQVAYYAAASSSVASSATTATSTAVSVPVATSSTSSSPMAVSTTSRPVSSSSLLTSSSTSTTQAFTTTSRSSLSSAITSSAVLTTTSTSTSTSTSSSSSAYLVLASPTPCNFGDPAGTDEDDSYCEIDLPFQMTMYTVSAPQTFASTNGYISMINGSSQYQVNPLPFSGIPATTIAPLFDDLYIYGSASPTQGIFYQVDASGVTYEYYLGRASNASLINHFTVRYNTANAGIFTYNYISVPGNGNSSSIGSQGLNSQGNAIGAQFSYLQPAVTAGSRVICNTNTNSCQSG